MPNDLKPTKEQLDRILDLLDRWMRVDDELQDALDRYVKVISPSSHAPIREYALTGSFISGVCAVFPKLQEDLAYYAYELPSMETAEGEKDGKKYDLKSRKQLIEFILA